MGFKHLPLKLAFRLKQFLVGDATNKRESESAKMPSWMTPISHGYHVVERSYRGGLEEFDSDVVDSVVVQREQIEDLELCFFGVFDDRIGGVVTKYMQSHLFDRKLTESQIKRKSKETMKRAHVSATTKIKETEQTEEKWKVGSASVMVIDGEKLVIANMGDYRAVVCRDGVAHQITKRNYHHLTKSHWSRKLISGALRLPKVRILACGDSGNAAVSRPSKNSELLVGTGRIDNDTEFAILASTGIWEVLKNQEAINLIRHIEDPQEAAECLAKEALTRMSRSNISCIVIRFDGLIQFHV